MKIKSTVQETENNKMMGKNSVLYTQWNDLVVIRFLRVDAPKEPVVSL